MSKIKIADDVAPNLVPMIDIMFLLLLFFMLSADMGQRELEQVLLPPATSATQDTRNTERLTINAYHRSPGELRCDAYADGNGRHTCREKAHWLVGIKGRDYTMPRKQGDLERLLKLEAGLERGPDLRNPAISERNVMIRVDASAPFGLAQQIMNLCAKAGMYKIEVGAAKAEKSR